MVTYLKFADPFLIFTLGLIHLYKTNYGFNITEEGPSDMLLLVHVPVDHDTHDLLRFLGNYDKKMEYIKIVRDQSLNQYMVLLKFDEQQSADTFYHSINGQKFNSLLEETCQGIQKLFQKTVIKVFISRVCGKSRTPTRW